MSSATATRGVPSRLELVTCVLFGAGLLLLLKLHLLTTLFAALLVYALVHMLVPRLYLPRVGHGGARLVAVTLIAMVVIALIALAGVSSVSFLRHSGESLPGLVRRMAEIIESSRSMLPAWLLQYVPADAEELRKDAVDWLKDNAQIFQVAGTGVGRALAHILIGMVIGALLSLEAASPHREGAPLTTCIAERGARLAEAFRRVVFAQFWISAINTIFTGIFLAVVLPLFGVHLPFTKTLILVTFVAGLIPILGNLISNTVICIVGLSQSLLVAVGALLYLVAIHKLEYFLNARIIGGHIRARAWELLIAMVVMEAAFGLPGVIAAPIYYAYAKDELLKRGLI